MLTFRFSSLANEYLSQIYLVLKPQNVLLINCKWDEKIYEKVFEKRDVDFAESPISLVMITIKFNPQVPRYTFLPDNFLAGFLGKSKILSGSKNK